MPVAVRLHDSCRSCRAKCPGPAPYCGLFGVCLEKYWAMPGKVCNGQVLGSLGFRRIVGRLAGGKDHHGRAGKVSKSLGGFAATEPPLYRSERQSTSTEKWHKDHPESYPAKKNVRRGARNKPQRPQEMTTKIAMRYRWQFFASKAVSACASRCSCQKCTRHSLLTWEGTPNIGPRYSRILSSRYDL